METIFRGSTANSAAVHGPFIYGGNQVAPPPLFPNYTDELQSSSVTFSGSLWRRSVVRMIDEHTFTLLQSNRETAQQNDFSQQKKLALIQLLRSWREEDQQEQKETWEYLKQALDEDRLSERKLFP